jgi:adenosylhomocysteinase
MGAHVIVTEVDPLRALEAALDGYDVMPMAGAAELGDVIVTATGDKDVVARRHVERMKDGAILANAGHFNVELDLSALRGLAVAVRGIRANVDEYTLESGRRVYVLAEGRVVNLAAAEGNPAAVMDVSFASQAFAAEHIVANAHDLERRVYDLPAEIDREVARLKLEALGIAIDTLTEEQERYLSSWDQS